MSGREGYQLDETMPGREGYQLNETMQGREGISWMRQCRGERDISWMRQCLGERYLLDETMPGKRDTKAFTKEEVDVNWLKVGPSDYINN